MEYLCGHTSDSGGPGGLLGCLNPLIDNAYMIEQLTINQLVGGGKVRSTKDRRRAFADHKQGGHRREEGIRGNRMWCSKFETVDFLTVVGLAGLTRGEVGYAVLAPLLTRNGHDTE